MVPQANDFTYLSLNGSDNSIRLLTLHPGVSKDPISCHLENASLQGQSMCYYEALSYMWGKEEAKTPIKVDGKIFKVRPNLFAALQNLRLPAKSRVLWIDAICINQQDLMERNHQVAQMASIYSYATQVLVWLGEATTESGIAMRFLSGFQSMHEELRVKQMHDARFDSLLKLCKLKYWNRLWIVQEVGLAENISIVCGKKSVPWHWLSDLLFCIEKHRESVSTAALAVANSMPSKLQKRRDARKTSTCYLSSLLLDCGDSDCADLHDKIFGFLGLANDYNEEFPIDYKMGLLELHAEVMSFQVHKTKKEAKTAYLYSSPHPDIFTLGIQVGKILDCRHRRDHDIFKKRNLSMQSTFRRDYPLVTYDNAIGIAKITDLEPMEKEPSKATCGQAEDAAVEDWLCKALPLDDYLKYSSSLVGNTDKSLKELLKTVVSTEHGAFPHSDKVLYVHSTSSYGTFSRDLSGAYASPPLSPEPPPSRAISHPKDFRYAPGRRFWSADGFLGFVPANTEKDDLLYSIPSVDKTLVLRKCGARLVVVGTADVRKSPLRANILAKLRNTERFPNVGIDFDMELFQVLVTE